MSEANNDGDEFPYPEGRVVAIIDTVDHLWSVVEALIAAGFIDTEIDAVHGSAAADKLAAGTGRKGVANVAMRFAAKIGLPNDEMAMRQRYEEALRLGQFVITVVAPTDDRKVHASQVIHDNGGTFIHFFGQRTFQVMSA